MPDWAFTFLPFAVTVVSVVAVSWLSWVTAGEEAQAQREREREKKYRRDLRDRALRKYLGEE